MILYGTVTPFQSPETSTELWDKMVETTDGQNAAPVGNYW